MPARSEVVESAREQKEKEYLETYLPLHELVPLRDTLTVCNATNSSLEVAMFLQLFRMEWKAGQAPSRRKLFEVS